MRPAALIVQARMTSRRLPGKVLKTVCGRPLLDLQLARLKRVKRADQVILATTDLPTDDAVAALGGALGVTVFRGQEDDVLGRFASAAQLTEATTLVRLTGDCPLLDPEIVDAHLALFDGADYDYVWCGDRPSLPNGFICEVFGRDRLLQAANAATDHYDREHVTPWIRAQLAAERIGAYHLPNDLSRYRLCVDTEEDFKLIERLLQNLIPQGDDFNLETVIKCLQAHPDWLALNQDIQQETGPFVGL